MRYRKKPIEIEAAEFTGNNLNQIATFTEGKAAINVSGNLSVATLEGDMEISPGDFVIKGIAGEFYPCKPDIFNASYDQVL